MEIKALENGPYVMAGTARHVGEDGRDVGFRAPETLLRIEP